MGLQLRREPSRKSQVILALAVIGALVVQPIYSLKNASFANAETITPAAPILVSPGNDAKVQGASVTQSWTNGGILPVDHYVYESYHDAALSNLRWRGNVQGTSKTATNVAESTFWWRVKAVDGNGASSPWSEVRKLTIDNTKPTASITFPAIGPGAISFKVKFNEAVNKTEADNLDNYFLHNWPGAPSFESLAGHATSNYDEATMTATVTFMDPNWYVSAEQDWGVRGIHDIAGNEMDSTNSYSTPLGNPVMTSTTLHENKNFVTWGWTADDFTTTNSEGAFGASGIKEYAYRLMKDSTVMVDWTTTTNSQFSKQLPDGAYTFSVKAWDNAGNEGNTLSVSFRLDSTAPVLTMDTPVLNEDGTYTVKVTTDDTTSDVQFYLDGALISGATPNDDKTGWTITTPALTPQTSHIITAKSTDSSGNAAADVQESFTVPVVSSSPLAVDVPDQIAEANTTGDFSNILNQQPSQKEQPKPDDTAVLGAQTLKDSTGSDIASITATPQGWKIFGVAWYWILLALAVFASMVWAIVSAVRRRVVAQDV